MKDVASHLSAMRLNDFVYYCEQTGNNCKKGLYSDSAKLLKCVCSSNVSH